MFPLIIRGRGRRHSTAAQARSTAQSTAENRRLMRASCEVRHRVAVFPARRWSAQPTLPIVSPLASRDLHELAVQVDGDRLIVEILDHPTAVVEQVEGHAVRGFEGAAERFQ